jgi:preprotein translocase subunit SecE
MPPAKMPARAARATAAKPQPQPQGRFSRAFGRFGAAQKTGAGRRGGNVVELVRDVRQEIKKVEWPSREEATKLTAAVVGLSAAVGIFLGGVDFIFQELFKLLIGLGNGGV